MAIAPNHDDLMMNLVLFSWFATTDIFRSLTDIDMKEMLYKERLKEIQDDVVPFGFIDDGEQHKRDLDDRDNPWYTRTDNEWYTEY